jgi:hypothetical protein
MTDKNQKGENIDGRFKIYWICIRTSIVSNAKNDQQNQTKILNKSSSCVKISNEKLLIITGYYADDR